MEHPGQLFNRIQRMKAHAAPTQPGNLPRQVAPAPIPPSAPVPPAPPAVDPAPTPAPAPPRTGHALYSQIMRSHDRMGTRHL